MADKSKKRGVFKGSHADLAEVYIDHCKEIDSPFLCRWPQEGADLDDTMIHSPINGVEARDHLSLLKKLHALFPKMCFTKSTVGAALTILRTRMLKKWPAMSESEWADWHKTMRARLRNMCRAVTQGQLKSPKADWVAALPWASAAEGETPESVIVQVSAVDLVPLNEHDLRDLPEIQEPAGRAAGEEGTKQSQWTFGMQEELQLPWRLRQGQPEADKEIGMWAGPAVQGNDSSFMIAEFPGGEKHLMPITVAMLAKKTRSAEILWQGEHNVSKNTVTLHQKVDRKLYIIMMEQGKQVCMVSTRTLGPVTNHAERLPLDDPTLKRAIAMMAEVGQAYCDGRVQRADLLKHRDKVLVKYDKQQKKEMAASKAKQAEDGDMAAPTAAVPKKRFRAKRPCDDVVDDAKEEAGDAAAQSKVLKKPAAVQHEPDAEPEKPSSPTPQLRDCIMAQFAPPAHDIALMFETIALENS